MQVLIVLCVCDTERSLKYIRKTIANRYHMPPVQQMHKELQNVKSELSTVNYEISRNSGTSKQIIQHTFSASQLQQKLSKIARLYSVLMT